MNGASRPPTAGCLPPPHSFILPVPADLARPPVLALAAVVVAGTAPGAPLQRGLPGDLVYLFASINVGVSLPRRKILKWHAA